MRRRRKESKAAEITAEIVAVMIVAIMAAVVIVLPEKEEQEQETIKQEEPEPITITIPETCEYGEITVYDGARETLFGYYGKIEIVNDGRDGKEIEIICTAEWELEGVGENE